MGEMTVTGKAQSHCESGEVLNAVTDLLQSGPQSEVRQVFMNRNSGLMLEDSAQMKRGRAKLSGKLRKC